VKRTTEMQVRAWAHVCVCVCVLAHPQSFAFWFPIMGQLELH